VSLAHDPHDESEPPTREHATQLLNRASSGDQAASDSFAQLLYADLRRVAGGLLRRERANHTLQPTALVHEAWMRLIDDTVMKQDAVGNARRRFLSHAAQAMRRILIEHARGRMREKRGGKVENVPLTESIMPGIEDAPDQIDLDAALTELATRKPRAAQLAELRIYGGLSTAEAADVVEVPLSTAKVVWSMASAFLSSRVRGAS